MLAKATSFTFMLKHWVERQSGDDLNLAGFIIETSTVPFLTQALHFCKARSDTYAELLKVSGSIDRLDSVFIGLKGKNSSTSGSLCE